MVFFTTYLDYKTYFFKLQQEICNFFRFRTKKIDLFRIFKHMFENICSILAKKVFIFHIRGILQ